MRPTIFMMILGIAVVSVPPPAISAAECNGCGCTNPCQKVCRLICKEKKVEVVCWGCECEDFCLPKRSQCDGKICEEIGGECKQSCSEKSVFSLPQTFVWIKWLPGQAAINTKKKLMKKTISKSIPSYQWVVEDLCPQCEATASHVPATNPADIPPPPKGDVRVIHPVVLQSGR